MLEDAISGESPSDELPAVRVSPEAGYLAPNATDSDGTSAYIHFAPEDMPIRVSVGLPKLAARYASREDTDAAVLRAVRVWENGVHPALPWFRLEIATERERDPDIYVEWKRRIRDGAAGWGGMRWETTADGELRVRSHLEHAMQPCLEISCQLELRQLELLVSHEFGHALGLGHCLDCDSAMNYSWETRERIFVTPIDLTTLHALYRIPSGTRVDSTRMRWLGEE